MLSSKYISFTYTHTHHILYSQGENGYIIVKKLHISPVCKCLWISPILSQFYPMKTMQCTDCLMKNQNLKINQHKKEPLMKSNILKKRSSITEQLSKFCFNIPLDVKIQ